MSSDSRFISQRAYARHRGVNINAVTEAIRSGRLVKCLVPDEFGVKKIGSVEAADQEWLENTEVAKAPWKEREKVAAATGVSAPQRSVLLPTAPPDELTLAGANALAKHWDACQRELDFKAAAKELVSAAEVKHEWTVLLSECRNKLLGVPTAVKQAIPELSVKDISTIDGLIRAALEDLVTTYDV